MKRLLAFVALFVSLSIPALAASNQKSVNIPEAVTVGTTQLPAGDYKISWTGSGPGVQVSFEQKGKGGAPTVVTAKAQDSADSRTLVTTSHANKSAQLVSIQLGKTILVFGGAAANGQ